MPGVLLYKCDKFQLGSAISHHQVTISNIFNTPGICVKFCFLFFTFIQIRVLNMYY